MTVTPAHSNETKTVAAPPSFADDLAFLERHGPMLVLKSGERRVALSAKYQGRVMTSAVSESGRSLGFVHREFIASEKTKTQFDNYGGEDRFWLGPEGGQFGLYFAPGDPFDFDHWQTPHALQEDAWNIHTKDERAVTFTRDMNVRNWSGTSFDVKIDRRIALLDGNAIRERLGLDAVPANVRDVAFESVNKVTNAGKRPWSKESGLLSIWILAMYAPAPDGRAIVPYTAPPGGTATPLVNDMYFGKVPADRLVVRERESVLLFACDGKFRSKIGLRPHRARNVLGSYSKDAKLLTIVTYDLPKSAASMPYVNSMWERQRAPYDGDVVNSYNDGPPAPGKPPLGGFYELETSSPALELNPGQSYSHAHRTFHFVGEKSDLDPIAKNALGVSLTELGL